MIKPLWAPQAGRGGREVGVGWGADTAHFHLYARWIPPNPPPHPSCLSSFGSRLFALFIGQSSAFQYGNSNSRSHRTSGSRSRHRGHHSAHYSFILFRSVVGETHEIHKLCNQRVLLRVSRGGWRRLQLAVEER